VKVIKYGKGYGKRKLGKICKCWYCKSVVQYTSKDVHTDWRDVESVLWCPVCETINKV